MFDAISVGEPGPTPRPDIEALFARSAERHGVRARFVVSAVEAPAAVDEQGAHPASLRAAATFAPNRRATFLAGRACARAALQLATGIDSPVPRSSDRSPTWPSGVSGSITHTEGFIAAVVAYRSGLVVGIDAEGVEATERDVSRRILTGAEADRVSASPDPVFATMAVFSAKEAFYKAQFQVTGAWVGFHDVTTIETEGGLELAPATSLAALEAVEWPILACQRELVGPTGRRIVVSAVTTKAS